MGKRRREEEPLDLGRREWGSGSSAQLLGHMTRLGQPSSDSGLAGLAAPRNIREGAWRAHGDRGSGGRAVLSMSGCGAWR